MSEQEDDNTVRTIAGKAPERAKIARDTAEYLKSGKKINIIIGARHAQLTQYNYVINAKTHCQRGLRR